MDNTNFQTIHQMGNAINNVVRQAMGRDNVQNIDMDYVTVAQRKRAVENTATGNPATFETNVIAPMGLLIPFAPVQSGSGDPSPENVRPISGWTGAEITRTGKLYEKSVLNGYVDTSGGYRTSTSGSKSICAHVDAGSIAIRKDTSSVFRIGLYASEPTENMSCISFENVDATETSYTMSVPSSCYLVVFVVNSSSSTDVANADAITGSVIIADTEIRTYPITFPSSAGTVYSGTLNVNEDGTGTLEVDMAMVTLGEVSSIKTSSAGTGKYVDYRIYDAYIDNSEKTAIAEKINIVARDNVTGIAWEGNIRLSMNESIQFGVYVPSDATVSQVNEALQGSNVVYKLATPVTYTLSEVEVIETLLGTNNIWSNTGDITVMYKNYEEVI